jgi:Na+/H+ antiporter NhaC
VLGPRVASAQTEFRIEAPSLVLIGIPFELTVSAVDANGATVPDYDGAPTVSGLSSGTFEGLAIDDAVIGAGGNHTVQVRDGAMTGEIEIRAIPGVMSILPPLLAITLALAFRQVVLSLFAGIWLAAAVINDYNIVSGFFAVLTHFVVNAITTESQAQILVFSLLFGGMVGVITRNGGARGIAELITRFAKGAKGGQLSTMLMALVLFFDDYANVLVRGNLMRPITDKLRVSREKLSFLVDTGAASVASTALISTWIGYEVGLIEQGLQIIGSAEDGYTMFIRTIPYRFYPLLALVFAFLISATDRDFGPMLKAERRARFEGKVIRDGAEPATETLDDQSDGDRPSSWLNGLAPIATILIVGLTGIYLTGRAALSPSDEATLGAIVGNSDSYVALLWASLSGCTVAILLAVARRALTLAEAFGAWVQGLKSMMMAIVILVLAWSIGAATTELQAAAYLVQVLEGALDPAWLPALTFVIAAAMAFATGTSWATMAIMMPLVIPLANALSSSAGFTPERVDTILVGVIASVLAGAVFGDHCSPISDTTILSSMASASDHIDHVRTQLPYALLVALVGIFVGSIPTAYGMSPWIANILGIAVLVAVLFLYAKPVGSPSTALAGASDTIADT